jgi:cyanate permease
MYFLVGMYTMFMVAITALAAIASIFGIDIHNAWHTIGLMWAGWIVLVLFGAVISQLKK